MVKKRLMIRRFKLFILTLHALFLSGCAHSRDEMLWNLGSLLFLIYSVLLSCVFYLPILHKSKIFQDLTNKLKPLIKITGTVILITGAIIFIFGIYLFAQPYGPQKLTLFLGTITIVLGKFINKWAKSENVEERINCSKVIGISISVLIAMLYFIIGAPMVE